MNFLGRVLTGLQQINVKAQTVHSPGTRENPGADTFIVNYGVAQLTTAASFLQEATGNSDGFLLRFRPRSKVILSYNCVPESPRDGGSRGSVCEVLRRA